MVCKTGCVRRDWRQEEELGESAISQTRDREHMREASGEWPGTWEGRYRHEGVQR